MAVTSSVVLFLAAEGEPSPLLPHKSELIVGLVAFTLLFLFLRAKVFPMFEKAFADRREAIEGGIARAEKAQQEAQASLEQYKAQLADAQAEAARIREQARAEGQQILDELRTQAQTESERIRARGEETLRGERQQVVAQLRGEIGRLAVDLAERIVGEQLDEQTRSRTVDRFLAELESDAGTATPVGQDA
jgi:F-type H+-transporting ATPase subunit b